MTLDETDRRLLDHLQGDAALSLEALGAAVAQSRNACWRRIKTRTALFDPEKPGPMAFVFLRSSDRASAWRARFSAAVRSMPEILGVYRMTGDPEDYLIRDRMADMAHPDRLYQRPTRRVPLSDVSDSFVIDNTKDTHRLPL